MRHCLLATALAVMSSGCQSARDPSIPQGPELALSWVVTPTGPITSADFLFSFKGNQAFSSRTYVRQADGTKRVLARAAHDADATFVVSLFPNELTVGNNQIVVEGRNAQGRLATLEAEVRKDEAGFTITSQLTPPALPNAAFLGTHDIDARRIVLTTNATTVECFNDTTEAFAACDVNELLVPLRDTGSGYSVMDRSLKLRLSLAGAATVELDYDPDPALAALRVYPCSSTLTADESLATFAQRLTGAAVNLCLGDITIIGDTGQAVFSGTPPLRVIGLSQSHARIENTREDEFGAAEPEENAQTLFDVNAGAGSNRQIMLANLRLQTRGIRGSILTGGGALASDVVMSYVDAFVEMPMEFSGGIKIAEAGRSVQLDHLSLNNGELDHEATLLQITDGEVVITHTTLRGGGNSLSLSGGSAAISDSSFTVTDPSKLAAVIFTQARPLTCTRCNLSGPWGGLSAFDGANVEVVDSVIRAGVGGLVVGGAPDSLGTMTASGTRIETNRRGVFLHNGTLTLNNCVIARRDLPDAMIDGLTESSNAIFFEDIEAAGTLPESLVTTTNGNLFCNMGTTHTFASVTSGANTTPASFELTNQQNGGAIVACPTF